MVNSANDESDRVTEVEEGFQAVESWLAAFERYKTSNPSTRIEICLMASNDNFQYTSKPIMTGEYLGWLVQQARRAQGNVG